MNSPFLPTIKQKKKVLYKLTAFFNIAFQASGELGAVPGHIKDRMSMLDVGIFSSLGEKTLKKNMAERLRTRTPHSQNVVSFFSLYHLGNLSFPVFKMGIKRAFIAQLAREHQDGAVTA